MKVKIGTHKSMIKIAIAWPVAWMLFAAGHITSIVMQWSWPFENGWPWHKLYPLYNCLMLASFDVQNWAGGLCGPWGPSASP